ncbi:hypothetical protein Tco_0215782 [Tanacetum coccineum]
MFVDFRTELVEAKVDDDQEAAKIKELMEIVPDEEEIAIDAIPLASMQIYTLVEKKYPLTPPTLSQMLEKNLQIDYESKMAYQLFIAALIDVNAAQSKLVLLENFNGNYSKCLRLLYKVNTAKGVNAASEEVSTTELDSTAYLTGTIQSQKDLIEWFEGFDGGGEDVVKRVSGFYVIGQILKLAKLFNDLFSGHERGRGWLVICSSMGSDGGLVHLGGKSSSEFKYRCGEVGGVVKMSSRGAKGVGSFGCGAIGDVSFEDMSMMFVRTTFLGGFLVENDALEAIFRS